MRIVFHCNHVNRVLTQTLACRAIYIPPLRGLCLFKSPRDGFRSDLVFGKSAPSDIRSHQYRWIL